MKKPLIPEALLRDYIRVVTHCSWCGYHIDAGHAACCPVARARGGSGADGPDGAREPLVEVVIDDYETARAFLGEPSASVLFEGGGQPDGLADDDLDWMDAASGSVPVGTIADVYVLDLTAEIRRLRRENRLLHLSRGSAPASMVGLD